MWRAAVRQAASSMRHLARASTRGAVCGMHSVRVGVTMSSVVRGGAAAPMGHGIRMYSDQAATILDTGLGEKARKLVEAHEAKADEHWGAGRVAEAIASLQAALDIDDFSAPLFAKMGDMLHLTGRSEDAIAAYSDALRIDSSMVLAYVLRASCYEQMGRVDEAVEDYKTATRVNRTCVPAYAGWGFNLLGRTDAMKDKVVRRRLRDAEDVFSRGLKHDAAHTDMLYGRGLVRMRLNELDDAVGDFTACIASNAAYAPAFQGRGECHHIAKRWRDAIADYTTFYDIFPAYYETSPHGASMPSGDHLMCDVLYKRGVCYENLPDTSLALADYNAIIEAALPAYHAKALVRRAKVFTQQGKWWEAVEDTTAALKMDGDLADAHKTRATAYEMLKMPEEAAEDERLAALKHRQTAWTRMGGQQ